jgi:hypothetical protein
MPHSYYRYKNLKLANSSVAEPGDFYGGFSSSGHFTMLVRISGLISLPFQIIVIIIARLF